ncbi:DUF1631 domain-containing protein [Verminephrobacter eiseniae]|uniref:Thymidine phosphorylase n=1 Tax=Verminephrobacter eiseniae (strain EF01-2) TaxID=391735 RepID=A1WQ83_VEREI|nr:DUF1631 domain-containing protein [Verminephrobacter eiseniae]ABM59790.1 conserved hypothetical protein [Verminephrobacter eiseniae EF01-2]MCW5285304.1 DUF1631 domain-containing protein [Verminephrobacter eiseniae]MCW5303012.1 DUF1631 domain-containing protein [Verminephrobacter eiseniae]MCW8181398.1 DUF1631 domain-containing protein [Verminephrobacter eiseniae]MCW8190448.1 DUF1631 domain-containing protein [Verminephrobacter eiseniae]
MPAPTAPSSAQRRLLRQARQMFVDGICAGLSELDQTLLDFLVELTQQAGTARQAQSRRDALMRYREFHGLWTERCARAWQEALIPHLSSTYGQTSAGGLHLELLSDDVVENKLLASRMALTISEQVHQPFDTLRQCTRSLQDQELESRDIFRPDTISLHLVEQWTNAGLPRVDLQTVVDPLQRKLADLLQKHYLAVNAFYDAQGVAPSDLKSRVRRTDTEKGVLSRNTQPGAQSQTMGWHSQYAGAGTGGDMPRFGPSSATPAESRLGRMVPAPAGMPAAFGPGGISPMEQQRQQAQGMVGQLHQLLTSAAGPAPASMALAQALAAYRMQAIASVDAGAGAGAIDGLASDAPVAVVQLVSAAREQSIELKQKAETPAEKATIEVVALMFQSILSEERIPVAVRIWFARLQVPVLRVALAEPDFFSNLDHPARKLIDRMGACAMGFNSTAIDGSALEAQVRRAVQMIEQYPETGSRVFQLVLDEFEKFLAKFLTEKQTTARLVTVAQQVEQKEALTIRYTIELRAMLRDMPVRDELRDFLFKVWAEVLALSALRDGPQHMDTITLKRTAADLVWSASAKPHRKDRTLVIQSLPSLLQRLRQGLALLGVTGPQQDAQIKVLTNTLADAFQCKTALIPQAQIESMAKRLDNLEDFISDTTLGDMPLNTENIEMLLGIDASSIHVVADNGTPVDDAMLAWAQQLPLGNWYTLDHNGVAVQAQYAWHSERKQLHLFATVDGRSYLIQLRRLATYLQAGLLLAQDNEGLTVRATRDALAKLGANPERLLN